VILLLLGIFLAALALIAIGVAIGVVFGDHIAEALDRWAS
jgi:hypothetical protein